MTAEGDGIDGNIPTDDSFYVYDQGAFLENLRTFRECFQKHYDRVQIALSVKTNYLPRLLRDAMEAGSLMEVVSDMEYKMVRLLGAPASEIVVNGPAKNPELISRALLDGALVQLDSPAEIDSVAAASAQSHGNQLRVGLRINVAPGPGQVSRFGFDAAAADFEGHIQRLRELPHVRLLGIHGHICSPQRTADCYKALVGRLFDVSSRIFPEPPDFINVGGGFLSPAPASFRAQFGFEWTEISDYGRTIASCFANRYGPTGKTRLVMEPGLAVDATAMRFFTKVLGIRSIGSQQVVSVAGTCYDIKPTKHQKNLPLERLSNGGEEQQISSSAIFVGNTCMEDDIIHRGYEGPLAVGDYLIFGHVGAYSLVLRPMFISPRPAVYMENKGSWSRIEAVQAWSDMFDYSSPSTDG